LSKIKSKWDPDMLFYVTPGINADHMIAKDGRLCKADGSTIKTAMNAAPYGDNENIWLGEINPPSFPQLYQGKGKAAKVLPLSTLLSLGGLLGESTGKPP
jgi:hypothetical protein